MGRASRQAGAALIVTLVTITALLVLGALTVRTLRTELVQTSQAGFAQVALYAAESGVAAGLEHLRGRCDPERGFTAFVEPDNRAPHSPAGIAGNGARPGEPGNLFDRVDRTAGAWYEVTVLNNAGDPGLSAGEDTDRTVVRRAPGRGPGRAATTVEVEARADCAGGPVALLGWREVP
jgi:esterase/lipase superfamily enzyme